MVLVAPMTSSPAPQPRRWRPAVLPTLAAIASIVLFVLAGQWQRARMEQKLALRAQLDAAVAQAPVPLPAREDWVSWRYRPVVMTGTFDAAHQILIDNRIRDGRAGYEVVTPLVLDDARVVLVNRGWTPGGVTRSDLPKVAVPATALRVEGRISLPTSRYLELGTGVTGTVWQNLDPHRYAETTGIPVLPIVIEQTRPLDAADKLARDWPQPDLGSDRHRIYMWQWYGFASLVAGLWLYFMFRRKR